MLLIALLAVLIGNRMTMLVETAAVRAGIAGELAWGSALIVIDPQAKPGFGRVTKVTPGSLKAADLLPILRENIAAEAIVMTDEAGQYRGLGDHFAAHGFTRHSAGQYVDYDNPTIHTNTIEGAFSIFKRGMKGVYQHCAKKHLHRYVGEFEFRYNNREALGCNDGDRSRAALRGVVGKRLTYSG